MMSNDFSAEVRSRARQMRKCGLGIESPPDLPFSTHGIVGEELGASTEATPIDACIHDFCAEP